MARDRGWYKQYRQEDESAVWRKPPLYLKFWQVCKSKSTWKDKAGVSVGSFIASYRELQELLEYDDDSGNPVHPSANTIAKMLRWFVSEHMIELDSTVRRRTVIRVPRFAHYQGIGESKPDAPAASQPPAMEEEKPLKKKPERKKKPATPAYRPTLEAKTALKMWTDKRPLPDSVDKKAACEVFDDIASGKAKKVKGKGCAPAIEYEGKDGLFAIIRVAVTEWERSWIRIPSGLVRPSKAYPELSKCQLIQLQIREGKTGNADVDDNRGERYTPPPGFGGGAK